ncbi:MAG: hypothetical protein SGPRY_008530 [Prymnesium sp.]
MAPAKHEDFWDSIAAAHRLDDGPAPERPILTPDPLESEPESDDEDRADGIFSPQFVQTTGVHEYMRTCREAQLVPVQQFISMLDHEVVSLKHRGVGPIGGRAIFECLRHNKHIQALDMEDNQLGLNVDVDAGHLDHLCAALRENQVITNLDLSYNNFAARGCIAIAEALEANGRIKELSLRGNHMSDMGAQRLAETATKSTKLSKLDVSDNGIGESGGSALGYLLSFSRPLKQADFSWNSVRAAGAIAIAEGLKLSSLVRLNLAWNGLGERGAAAMGLALKENASLLFLDLSSNRISEWQKRLDQRAYCSTKKTAVGLLDPLNPTGRYTLDLSKEPDRELFKRLKQFESSDESTGEDNFMNCRYNSKSIECNIQEWPVPETGILQLDYVSSKRVPKEAKAQRDEVFAAFYKELANPALSDETKLLMLRSTATTHFWNCNQARQLVQLITYRQRVDAVIILFRRIIDLEMSFFSVLYSALKPCECASLRARLGSSLRGMLPEKPLEPEEAAVVFLTEQHEGLVDEERAVPTPKEATTGQEDRSDDDSKARLAADEQQVPQATADDGTDFGTALPEQA